MKLLLTSAGMNVKDEIVNMLPKPTNQIRLAHIITASKPELNKNYLMKDKDGMKDLGFDVEDIDIEGKNQMELREIFKDKEIIYVQGGNAFYLLKAVKESGFDQVVKDLINQGKIYIGVSAGSYIACPTIEQAKWKHQDRNHCGLTDLKALNLVPFLITAHFEEKYRPVIEQAAKACRYPIVALNDTQAILIEDEKYKLVGKGKKEFFNGYKEKYES
ncbi:hypothetical protein CO166_02285 [Candidatus Roizmanbacteria bacterium CG_4_9_14_3_um_filter_36_11]|nr:MAG: hypothetical protein CO166_02285 [Candidatus Roizmanbacteria bacterium CG_4_9_14_3_um_filter_36_11]